MRTIRDFVSIVKENLNSSTLDGAISNEHIYWVGVNIAKLLIKRETESRKIFKNTSLFKPLCVPMIQVNGNECGIVLPCNKIMRSEKQLPKGFLTNFGSLLLVFNLTRDKDYKEISMTAYKNVGKQKYKSKTGYFWIEDNYLYVPDSEVEELKVLGLFTDPEEIAKYEGSTCSKILDSMFPCPDYFYSTIIEITSNQLSTRIRIPKDEDGNLNSNDKQ